MRVPLFKRIITVDSSEPAVNGKPKSRLTSAFGKRENRERIGKERSIRWDARRCWHEHPYWSDNLKYVY
jgi:hypothetical protein